MQEEAQRQAPFGKYILQDRIAAGGMAEIYRARLNAAAGITKPVVIKKILPHYAGNRAFIQMFINEAKIAVGLSHGNIAQVFDFGEIEGEYYLAMELVHGQPLHKLLRRAKEQRIPALPTPFALFIGVEMARGLHYAHTRLDEKGRPLNIVHRDVSSHNVIVSYEGQVKLVDFGIARARNAAPKEEEGSAVKGKYIYFSPEQARGEEVDSRSDVFSLGIVLYELLCGRLPFEGKMIRVMGNIIEGRFDPPRAKNPDITPQLESILMRALATHRDERYQTAQELGDALATYLYANNPTFTAQQLGRFVSYLFERELVSEGLPVQLPPDFLEQVPHWQKRLPTPPDDDAQPEAPRISRPKQPLLKDDEDTRPQDPTGAIDVPSEAVELPPRKRSMLIAIPVAAALLGALGVVLFGRIPSAPHENVAAPTPAPATAPAPPPSPPAFVVTKAPAPPPEPPADLPFPADGALLRPAQHFVELANTPAARVRLEPALTYRLKGEGHPLFLADIGGQGVLLDGATHLEHAQTLYAFAVGADSKNSAPRALIEPLHGRPTVLPVEPFQPEPSRRLRITGLHPDDSYDLVLGGEARPSKKSARLRVVAYSSLGEALHPARIIEPGQRYRLRGADAVALFVPTLGGSEQHPPVRVHVTRATHARATPL